MKNTLKKVLALILALCTVAVMLVACTEPAETTGEKETTTANNGADNPDDGNGNDGEETSKKDPPKDPVDNGGVFPETESTQKPDPLPEGDPESDPAVKDIFD